MIKLDDFLTKKKEPAQVLDLSKVKITSKEEFKKYFDKIPECKVKPEKISHESIKIKDKEFSFVPSKREEKHIREWNYPDPTPPDMKGAKLEDLYPVNIDWKMLTTLRPKTKVEEDMFSRLVQLGKLNLKYQQSLQREKTTDWVRKTKNPKSSILEIRVLSCKECGEDFCNGDMCSKLMYEHFFRPQVSNSGPSQNLLLTAEGEGNTKKKKKKKQKRKMKKRSSSKGKRKLGKNSIFNRPISRGCSRDHTRSAKKSAEKMPSRRAVSCTRSFSTERQRTSFYEGRSKSAPRIHFDCDISDSKSRRYESVSDSGPSRTDYSSQSDSESAEFHKRFIPSRLRLSGRRKLLSARVEFVKKNRRSSSESSRPKFIRKCTLYKDYHSDASIPEIKTDDYDSSSGSSPTHCRQISKFSDRLGTSSSIRHHASTVRIQFDEFHVSPGLRFPEKMYLPSRITTVSTKIKNVQHTRSVEVAKVSENFSNMELEFNRDSVKHCILLPRKPKTENFLHNYNIKMAKLSKFSGPYLKAKGLFMKKSE